MKLLISAGGSGGGVYPALSILQAFAQGSVEVLWVGGEDGMEAELVEREGIPFRGIPAAGLHGVGLRTLPGIVRLGRGYLAARRILKSFQPDALLFTGGYMAVPVALAGRGRAPILLYVPDIEPGLALRTLARFADRIALIAGESRKYFPGRESALRVTGHPVRKELARWLGAGKTEAQSALGLRPGVPTLLVFGGSKGARSINRAVLAALPALLDEMQIVHLSGRLDWQEVSEAKAGLPVDRAGAYRAFPYLHEEMGAAYAAADLVLSRAGASAVGEFPLFGLPAVLAPYPHAWRYQAVNADYLASHGAAVVVQDADLPGKMTGTVLELMRNRERREAMREAMRSLASPDAARDIAGLLAELAGRADGVNKPV